MTNLFYVPILQVKWIYRLRLDTQRIMTMIASTKWKSIDRHDRNKVLGIFLKNAPERLFKSSICSTVNCVRMMGALSSNVRLDNQNNQNSCQRIAKALRHQRTVHITDEAINKVVHEAHYSMRSKAERLWRRSEVCEVLKETRIVTKGKRIIKAEKRIQTDICGPIRTSSFGKNTYFLTMTITPKGYYEVKVLKNKTWLTEHLVNHILGTERGSGRKVKRVHSDNGCKFIAAHARLQSIGLNPTTKST